MRYCTIMIVLGLGALRLLSAPDPSTIRFENVAGKAGVNFVTRNSPTPNKNQIETMVAGVGLLDYDGDGFLDIYLVNGAAIPSLQKESPAYWNRLFHNNGDGTFTDVTAKAGLTGALFNGKKMWSVGAGWFDYNNDGLLDLFVVNYCVWEVNQDPYCSIKNGVRAYCHPKQYASLHNTLYRNNGDGTFTDVSKETGISAHIGKGMSVSFADYDGDGFIDAFVANDTTPAFLFHNLGGKKFEEVGVTAGAAYAPDGSTLSGMGSDFRDTNNDGRPDIWYTAVEHETFPLLINSGHKDFDDVTLTSGLRPTTEMSGWSNGIYDFDNDGWKDLFVARGNVLDNISELTPSRRYPEPNSVFHNLGAGKFQDVSASAGSELSAEAPHRGAAFGDLDNDGRVDIVVSVLGGQVQLFHNLSAPDNHWILLKLIGTKSNRMSIGAQIHITTEDGRSQWNEVTTAVGYASSSDSRVHFGLGANKHVKTVEIRWPSGIRQIVNDPPIDRVITIEEPRQ